MHLTGEEILPPDQNRLITQATFTYSVKGKDLKSKQKLLKGTNE